jgi:hypothetical protein
MSMPVSTRELLRELLPVSGLIGSLTLVLLSDASGMIVADADAQPRPTRTVPGATSPATSAAAPANAQAKSIILVDLGHGQTFFLLPAARRFRLSRAVAPHDYFRFDARLRPVL